MVKYDSLCHAVEELAEILRTKSEKSRNNPITGEQLNALKEASLIANNVAANSPLTEWKKNGVMDFIQLLAECLNDANADVRIFCEGQYCTIVEKIVRTGSPLSIDSALFLVLKHLEELRSGRHIVFFLPIIYQLLLIKPLTKNQRSYEKCSFSNRFIACIQKITLMNETIVHQAVIDNFSNIFSMIHPDSKLIKEFLKHSLQQLYSSSGSKLRAFTSIVGTINNFHREFASETLITLMEKVISDSVKIGKPPIGSLMALKVLLKYSNFEKHETNLKKVFEIVLALITQSSVDIRFAAFAVLEEILLLIPSGMNECELPHYYNSEVSTGLVMPDNVKKEEEEEDENEFVDPLLNPMEYENVRNEIEASLPTIDLQLPSRKLLYEDENPSMSKYAVALVAKAFLLTGRKGVVKNSSESKDSMKVLAIDCLSVVAKRFGLQTTNVLFGDRFQTIHDVQYFAFHNDNTIFKKTIQLLPLLISDSNVNDFNETIGRIIEINEFSRKTVLLEAFSERNILPIYRCEIFPKFIDEGILFCKSSSFDKRISGARFLSSIVFLNDFGININKKHKSIIIETLIGINDEKTIGILLDFIVRIYNIEVRNIPAFPPVCLDMTSNSQIPMTIKYHEQYTNNYNRCAEFIEHINHLANNGKLEKDAFFIILQQLRKFLPLPGIVECCGVSMDEYLEILMKQKMKKSQLFSLIDICCAKQYSEWVSYLSTPNETFYENIDKTLLFGTKFLNLIIDICDEKESNCKQSSTLDQECLDSDNVKPPMRNILPRLSTVPDTFEVLDNYENFISLLAIYNDIKGAYSNFKTSIISREKLYTFIEKASLIICSSLEYCPKIEQKQFQSLVENCESLMTINSSSSLRILQQIIKVWFQKHLGRLDSKSANTFIKEQEFLKHYDSARILHQLSNDQSFGHIIIGRALGWLWTYSSQKPLKFNKEMSASLSFLEKAISSMIRIYRIRGAKEKSKITSILCELISFGFRHDSVDPKGFIYEEMDQYLQDPSNSDHADLLPAMMHLMIVLVRIRVRKPNQLIEAATRLLDVNQFKNSLYISYSTEAAIIAISECVLQKYDMDKISSNLCKITHDALRIIPNEIMYIWFMILSHSNINKERQLLTETFLRNYEGWMNEDMQLEISLNNLLLPLSKITATKIDKIEKINMKTFALAISFIYKCENEEDIDELSKSLLIRILHEVYTKHKHLRSIMTEIVATKKLKFLMETIDHYEAPEPKGKRSQLIVSLKKKTIEANKNAETLRLIGSKNATLVDILSCVNRNGPRDWKAVAKYITKLDIEDLWDVCRKQFYYCETDAFWKALCTEFRQQILAAEVYTLQSEPESVSEINNLSAKFQIIVDRCINLLQSSLHEIQIIKLMANFTDIKVNLDLITNEDIIRLFSLVMEELENGGIKLYLLKGIRHIITNDSVLKKIKEAPLITLPSYLNFVDHILSEYNCSDDIRHLLDYLCFMINPEITDSQTNSCAVKDILKRSFICTQRALSNFSEICHEEEKRCLSALLRHPTMYSFSMVFKDILEEEKTLKIEVNADGNLTIPFPKIHYLCNYNVLQHFQTKLSIIGWISRQNFDEICVSLLGVLSTTPIGKEILEMDDDACQERIKYCALAVKIFTSVLLMSIKFPLNGDPNSKYILKYREIYAPFFSSTEYKELSILKSLLKGHPKNAFSQPIERWRMNEEWDGTSEEYGLCQLSLLSIWTINGVIPGESGSPPPQTMNTTLRPSISKYLIEHSSDLDTISNVKSIMNFFSHWFAHGIETIPISLLSSVISCLQYSSDFFDEPEHFRFVFNQMKIACSSDYIHGAACVGPAIELILKSLSAIGVDEIDSNKNPGEKQKLILKWIENGLHTTVKHHAIQTLAGFIYLIQSMSLDVMKRVIEYVSLFLEKKLLTISQDGEFDEYCSFAISASFEILKLPLEYCSNREGLEKMLIQLLSKCSDREKEDLIIEGIEQLICHSGAFSLKFLNTYNSILKSPVELKTESYIRIYLAIFMRCEADELNIPQNYTKEISAFLYESWPSLYLRHSNCQWACRTVSFLLLKIGGVETTLLQLLDLFNANIDKTLTLNGYAFLFFEVLMNIRARKAWGRELRRCKDLIVEKIMRFKETYVTLYQALILMLSPRPEVYLKIYLLLPLGNIEVNLEEICNDCIEEFKAIS